LGKQNCWHGAIVDPTMPFSMEQEELLLAIPGLKIRGGVLRVPENAWPIIGNALDGNIDYMAQRVSPESDEVVVDDLRPFVADMLTDYQNEGIDFACARPGSHFWWPCGAGKTLAAIVWALRCAGPVLIVVRASARRQWEVETKRFADIEPFVWKPVSLRRKKDKWADTAAYLEWCEEKEQRPFMIVAWETLQSALSDIRLMQPISVVYDESHKGKSNKRWQAIMKEDGSLKFKKRENLTSAAMDISRMAQRRLCTTATPVKNRLRDLWAQLDLSDPGMWGAFYPWAIRYCAAKPGPFGGMDCDGRSNLAELQSRINTVAHVVPYATTHAQLPPKRRQVTYLAVEDQCKPAAMKREIARAHKMGGSSVLEVLLQEAASRKRKFIVDLVKENTASGSGKIVVFTGRRKDAEELARQIGNALKDTKVWMGHGDTNVHDRDIMREAYMAHAGPCVLVGTGDAWGESLNLQDTDALILAMLPYTPGQVVQWEGRVSRLGQKRPVLIYYVIAEGTVDERVAALLLDKLPAVEAVVGDGVAGALHDELMGVNDEDELIESMLSKIGVGE